MSECYGQANWDEPVATIRRALALGVTFLDTADVYGDGHHEVLAGRSSHGRRDQVQFATQCGIDGAAKTRLPAPWQQEPPMIPTLIVAGLLVGRWWVLGLAAIAWPALLALDGVGGGPEFVFMAAVLAVANTAVGVAVRRALRWAVPRMRDRANVGHRGAGS